MHFAIEVITPKQTKCLYEVMYPLFVGDDREGIFLSCYIDDRDYHQEMAKVYVMVHLETFYIDHYIDQQADKRGASSF